MEDCKLFLFFGALGLCMGKNKMCLQMRWLIDSFVSTKVFLFDLLSVNYLIETVAELSVVELSAAVAVSADCFVIPVAD